MAIQDLITMVSALAAAMAAIAAVIGLPWWLRGKFADIDAKFERLGQNISLLARSVAGIMTVQEIVLGVLSKARLIEEEDQRSLFKAFREGAEESIRSMKFSANPLTPGEVQRLEYYRNKLLEGGDFTPEEAIEFHKLAHRLKAERPDQEGTWVFVALAAFLLGMHTGSKK